MFWGHLKGAIKGAFGYYVTIKKLGLGNFMDFGLILKFILWMPSKTLSKRNVISNQTLRLFKNSIQVDKLNFKII